MASDEGGAHRSAGLDQRVGDGRDRPPLRHRNQQRRAVEGPVGHRDHLGERAERLGRLAALQPDTRTLHTSTSVTMASGAARDRRKTGTRGRMVGALDEGQPRDDLGRGVEFERVPPGAGARHREGRHQPEVALGFGDRGHHGAAPICATNGTVKPKWKRAESRIRASPADRSACTENGACT